MGHTLFEMIIIELYNSRKAGCYAEYTVILTLCVGVFKVKLHPKSAFWASKHHLLGALKVDFQLYQF